MPELPEVETVRRVLLPHLQNRTILNVRIYDPALVAAPSWELFTAGVRGQRIADLARRGKFLQICFMSGDRLTVHLRMTGALTVEPQAAPAGRHTRAAFSLSGGEELRYEDVRRLGKMWFAKNGEEDHSGIAALGVEPFDAALTPLYLENRGKNGKKPVKSTLLDQSVVAGIGNIYADEILFAANIRPDKPCNALTDGEFARLAKAIPERLDFFIGKNEISFEDYLLGKGKEYRNTPYLQVYGKAGTPCPACGETLRRVVLGGRSSVFCPRCQK